MGKNGNKTRSPLTFRQEKDNRWLSATKQNNFWVCRIAWNGFRVFQWISQKLSSAYSATRRGCYALHESSRV